MSTTCEVGFSLAWIDGWIHVTHYAYVGLDDTTRGPFLLPILGAAHQTQDMTPLTIHQHHTCTCSSASVLASVMHPGTFFHTVCPADVIHPIKAARDGLFNRRPILLALSLGQKRVAISMCKVDANNSISVFSLFPVYVCLCSIVTRGRIPVACCL